MTAAPDPFEGPFLLWGQLVDPEGPPTSGPQRTVARRLRGLGRWLRDRNWYLDGALTPVALYDSNGGWSDSVQVSAVATWQLDTPVVVAHLCCSLGEIVEHGPRDHAAVIRRIEGSVEYFADLVFSRQDGHGVCRSVGAIRPAAQGGYFRHRLCVPAPELARRVVGLLEAPPRHRARTLALAPEAVRVYNAAVARGDNPAVAVADHFGWREPDTPWYEDYRARRKVDRMMQSAEAMGLTPPTKPRHRRTPAQLDGREQPTPRPIPAPERR